MQLLYQRTFRYFKPGKPNCRRASNKIMFAEFARLKDRSRVSALIGILIAVSACAAMKSRGSPSCLLTEQKHVLVSVSRLSIDLPTLGRRQEQAGAVSVGRILA